MAIEADSRTAIRSQLQDRRRRLEAALREQESETLVRLLAEVDGALTRIEAGTYGICELCREPIDGHNLHALPLMRYCLCDLTPDQQSALQHDLDLAWRIQAGLLPPQDALVDGWQVHYRYQPYGPVSGDYCDLLLPETAGHDVFFALGDVSGKGIAASLVMAHLNASFRGLADLGLPLDEMVRRANRQLLQSTIASHYVTMICGRASADGSMTICNAGHPPAMVVHGGGVDTIPSGGLPLGISAEPAIAIKETRLEPGDALFLYTDGLTESRNGSGEEYGLGRLTGWLAGRHGRPARELARESVDEIEFYRGGTPLGDDLTVMVLARS